jgi:DNA topoisomerase-6 subunit B
MKLGEFIGHAHLFGKLTFSKFLKTGFSRVSDQAIQDFVKNGMPKKVLNEATIKLSQEDYKLCFQAIQAAELMSPSTKSVLVVGEEALTKSIQRLGEIDFFSVVARKPRICDFKPVSVEVAIARFKNRGEADDPVQLLRFANRVPLQFDKSACAITQAVTSVNWRSYGLGQPKDSLPVGPFVFAVSVVSPFIKFKNASKETIDASDELVEEIRRALMQAGQKLSRHIRREDRESDLEQKLLHIEKFGPVLIEILGKITKAPKDRIQRAEEGLKKLLGRDTKVAEKQLEDAHADLETLKAKSKINPDEILSEAEAMEAPAKEKKQNKKPRSPAKKSKTK